MGWHPQALWDTAPLSAVLPNPHAYFDPIAAITLAAQHTTTTRMESLRSTKPLSVTAG